MKKFLCFFWKPVMFEIYHRQMRQGKKEESLYRPKKKKRRLKIFISYFKEKRYANMISTQRKEQRKIESPNHIGWFDRNDMHFMRFAPRNHHEPNQRDRDAGDRKEMRQEEKRSVDEPRTQRIKPETRHPRKLWNLHTRHSKGVDSRR